MRVFVLLRVMSQYVYVGVGVYERERERESVCV